MRSKGVSNLFHSQNIHDTKLRSIKKVQMPSSLTNVHNIKIKHAMCTGCRMVHGQVTFLRSSCSGSEHHAKNTDTSLAICDTVAGVPSG